MNPSLHVRRLAGVIAKLLCLLLVIAFFEPQLHAQEAAFVSGSGKWSDAANWDCMCVPNGNNYAVNLQSGDVTLDIDAAVGSLVGSGNLSIDGKTLTAATVGDGIFEGGTLQLTGGAKIVSAPGVAAGILIVDSATLPNVGVLQSAVISSSSLQSLRSQGSVNISNSSIGGGLVSDLTLLAPSQITNSSVSTGLQFVQGGSLVVDQSTILNVPTGSAGVDIFGGAMTLQGASTLNLNFGELSMGTPSVPSSLTVDGAGTAINLADTQGINMLGLGDATLTIQNHAAINGGSTNALLVGSPLPGFSFGGHSHVLIKSGSTVTIGDVSVSGTFGAPSSIDVTDQGSQLTISKTLDIFGGTLTVEKQGAVTSDLLDIGSPDVTEVGRVIVDSGGTLTLDGSSHDQNLLVGSSGRGELTIQNGGSGTGIQSLVLGNDAASSGTMTITGAGENSTASRWENAGTLYVGYDGNGTLNVTNLGELVTDGAPPGGGNLAAVIGTQAGSTGTATVNGGTWDLGGNLEVGESGTGSLVIATDLPGAKSVSSVVQGTGAVIGLQSGSLGTVTISGNGARWDNAGDVTVGATGHATLSILNGGEVSDGNGYIAFSENSSPGAATDASVTVDGQGSQWNNSKLVLVGLQGNASLTISGGGGVSDSEGIIGNTAGQGSVTVTGNGSQWLNNGPLFVAPDGTGSLSLEDGGKVAATNIEIGGTGMGTVIINGGDLNGSGHFILDGNSTLTLSGGSIETGVSGIIGATKGSSSATVSGGSWTLGGALIIGSGASNTGSLTVTSGGAVTVGEPLTVNPTGTLTVQGGVINGNVVNAGGTITPGDATGIMTVNGNYIQDAGLLLMEIDGTNSSQFDQLLVSGLAQFNGGTIEILFGNGFTPMNGENFDLIAANLGLTDAGVHIDVEGLANGFQLRDSFTANGFEISLENKGSTGTPEPGTISLLAVGLASVLGLRLQRGSHHRI